MCCGHLVGLAEGLSHPTGWIIECGHPWGLLLSLPQRSYTLCLSFHIFELKGENDQAQRDERTTQQKEAGLLLPTRVSLPTTQDRLWNKEGNSVQFSHSVLSDCLQPHGLQHDRPPCPSATPRVYSNSCPSSRWCHTTISSSVVSFSSCLQSFPASESFPMSQFFVSGGQTIGISASASASVLPMNIQDWFPLRLTSLIFLQSKGLSRVFSSSTVWGVLNKYFFIGKIKA